MRRAKDNIWAVLEEWCCLAISKHICTDSHTHTHGHGLPNFLFYFDILLSANSYPASRPCSAPYWRCAKVNVAKGNDNVDQDADGAIAVVEVAARAAHHQQHHVAKLKFSIKIMPLLSLGLSLKQDKTRVLCCQPNEESWEIEDMRWKYRVKADTGISSALEFLQLETFETIL